VARHYPTQRRRSELKRGNRKSKLEKHSLPH
jgi:hypothetical protein